MRENNRVSQEKYELALTARQAAGVLVVALLVGGSTFYLGTVVGRRSTEEASGSGGPKDALARLDAPPAVHDESPPELKAQQALVDSRSIDKAMPVAATPPALTATPGEDDRAGEENTTPPSVVTTAPLHPALPPAVAPPLPNPVGVATHSTRPSTSPSGRYTIQVASAPRRVDAERLAKKLSARKAKVVVADVPGKGRWYRVQVGLYPTREAARVQLASLERSGVHGIVASVRSP
jgi:DedD protein